MRHAPAGLRSWVLWAAVAGVLAVPAQAQNRGVYPLGLSVFNSGVGAAPGYTYNNSFLFYSRDEQKGGNGEVLATGQQSVLLDMNTLLWASAEKVAMLGNAGFASAIDRADCQQLAQFRARTAPSAGAVASAIFTFSP